MVQHNKSVFALILVWMLILGVYYGYYSYYGSRSNAYGLRRVDFKGIVEENPVITRSDNLKANIKEACKQITDPHVFLSLNFDRYSTKHKERLDFNYNHENWWMALSIDKVHKVIFPILSKCGSTNLRYFMYALDKNITGYSYNRSVMEDVYVYMRKKEFSLRWLGPSTSAYHAELALKRYFKFAFFRDPLERLHSAYRHIFVDKAFIKKLWNQQKINMIAEQVKEEYGEVDDPFSFKDFLRYLMLKKSLTNADIHWRPQVYMAHPCAIEYDFVGHTSTMTEDMQFIAREVLGVNFSIPEKEGTTRLEDVLGLAPLELIKQVLFKHYRNDYKILGFEFPK